MFQLGFERKVLFVALEPFRNYRAFCFSLLHMDSMYVYLNMRIGAMLSHYFPSMLLFTQYV